MYSLYYGGTESDPTGSAMKYLGHSDYGVTVNLEKFELLLKAQADVQSVPYGFAGTSWGTHYPPKNITLPCWLVGTSWQDTKRKARNLSYLLNKNRLVALRLEDLDFLQWDDATTSSVYWLVRYMGGAPSNIYGMGLTFDLEFIAPDPRAFTVSETTQSVSLSGNTNFNVPASGVVQGNVEPDVTWIVKPTGSGATSPLVLTNTTRDEAITWGNTLTTAQWLRFRAHATLEKVDRSSDSGASYTEQMGSLMAGSRFPKLDPNAQNACSITGVASTGTLDISYRARYL